MRTMPDGLFFHPNGSGAAAVLKRMEEGTTNYNLDDPFLPAMHETRQEIAMNCPEFVGDHQLK